ncbi:unnamed protein product [Ilex paraguariensis]|uniref:Cation/H(+) antiporter central domain-containing protein n=1 Tax=Ilex paraguariensis TaxID=185542 RepID=A0ABC8T916_9AQUA
MIMLPFHRQWKKTNGDDEVANLGHSWREVNQRVLKDAPCSVALLVDRGFGGGFQQTPRPTAIVAQRKDGIEINAVMLRSSPNKCRGEL